jgi:hypothetical protein
MSETTEKEKQLAIQEANDGSATVDLPSDLIANDFDEGQDPPKKAEGGEINDQHADDDHPDDDAELREAKRNRRRAKKDLIRKTNQEKDARLVALQRENEEFRRRLESVERNTRSGDLVRLEKSIEDAEVQMNYAKMKMSEAVSGGDGQALVEAQQLYDSARDAARELNYRKQQVDQELRQPKKQVDLPDPQVQRNAADWINRNSWYDPQGRDSDSRIAKKIDELMSTQGWDPTDPDYWDELDTRLQRELPHRYNKGNDNDSVVRKPRNSVASSGREASAAYGGTNRTQFVLSPDRVRAMKEAGAWDNPERKARMIKGFIEFDRQNGRRN